MIDDEEQHQLVVELADLLADSPLDIADLLEPVMFVVTEIVAQMTEYNYNEAFTNDVAELFEQGVLRHCMMEETACTIQIQ